MKAWAQAGAGVWPRPRHGHRGLHGLALAAALACATTAPVQAASYVWKGGSGSWTNAASWVQLSVPGVSDTATLGSGTATLSVDQEVAGLVMSGGTRSGTGTLTLGSLDWSGGSFSGAGTTTVTGAAAISHVSTPTIASGHTLRLQGQSTWVAANSAMIAGTGGSIVNAVGATFTDAGNLNDGYTRHLGHTTGSFINEGNFVRAGLGATYAYGLTNTGLVDVQGGTLQLQSASTVAGQVAVAAGAVLEFGSGISALNASTSGSGVVRISGGTVSLGSPAVLGSTLELAGGVLDVQSNQSFSSLVLNGGTLRGTGQSTVTGQTTLTTTGGSNARIDAGHTLTLQGDTLWDSATGRINLVGTMANAVGATVTDTGGGTHHLGNDGSGVFNNAGTYVRSGTGTTNATGFNNTGLLDVRGGVFTSRGNSTMGGTTTLASGGVLGFIAGTSSITGAVSGPGVVRVNGGTLNLGASANVGSTVEVSSGTLAAQSDNSLSRLVMSGSGTRSGTGTLTLGSLDWSGGSFSGAGTTTVTGAATISHVSTPSIASGHTLRLQGQSTWVAADSAMIAGTGGSIVNAVGATFTDAGTINTGGARHLGYTTGSFINEGNFVRAGLGTTNLYGLANTGLLDVQGGTLQLQSASTVAGQVAVAAGAVLEFGRGVSALNASTSGGGVVRIGGGTVSLGSQAVLGSTLELAGGVLDVQSNQSFSSLVLNGGTLRGTGQSTVTGQTTLTTTGGSNARIDAGHTLTLQGDTMWDSATGRINLVGTMANAVGATVTDTGGGTHHLGNGGSGVFNNAGTYVRSGTGTTNATGFNNTGLLDVRGGVFTSRGNSTMGGSTTLSASGALGFSAGTSSITGAVSGPGVVRVNGGTLNLGASANVGSTVEVSSGTLAAQSTNTLSRLVMSGSGTRSGTGTLTLGSLDWSGGSFSGAGTTTVTGVATISHVSTPTIASGHTLRLQGQSTWVAANSAVISGNGGSIVNAVGATFTDAGNLNDGYARYLGHTTGSFINEGNFVRSGLGATYAYGLTNTGLVDVQSGTLSVNQGFKNLGTVQVAAGATLAAFQSTFNNAGLLRGNGAIRTSNSNSALHNTGTIDPGAAGAIGTLALTGDLALDAGGTLHIDLGTGGLSDLITVSDALQLGGLLQLQVADGAVLHDGDVFTIATFASLSGSRFERIDWGGAAGFGYSVVYGSSSIELRVAAVPEPENLALAACGLALVWGGWRRRVHALKVA